MQIKYRITLVYTLVVSILLLLLCTSIYIFTQQDRKSLFEKRLSARASSFEGLLRITEFDSTAIKKIIRSSSGFLQKRSMYVYDSMGRTIFFDNTPDASSITLSPEAVRSQASSTSPYFKIEDRDAIFLSYNDTKNQGYIVVAAMDVDAQEWLAKLRIILLICFIASILLVIASGYIFSIGLVKSFSNLITDINHISSAKFSTRLDSGTGKDELQKLAMTINSLLDRLQYAFDTQRRFIDNASHELSTPLTAIYSQLDVALQKSRTTEEYSNTMLSVKDDVNRLNLLVRSLLEIAKASGSERGLELANVRIDELLMQLPAEMRKISTDYDIILDFEEFPESESSFAIFGNEPLLFIAIKNIVHNACKYSKDTTAIVKLNFTDKHIIITVEDNGIGIPETELKNVFQPFYRGTQYNNVIPGVGLGLSLANHIISLHHGFIEAHSKINVGSSFKVYLPLQA